MPMYYLARRCENNDIIISKNPVDVENKFKVKIDWQNIKIGDVRFLFNFKYETSLILVKINFIYNGFKLIGVDELRDEPKLSAKFREVIQYDYGNYCGYIIFLQCAKAARLPVAKDIKKLIFGFLF